jgi:hypothetical protein
MVVDPSHAALGMALPATAEPTGKASERTKGNVSTLQPGESVHFGVEAGALDKDKTTKMAAKIAELLEWRPFRGAGRGAWQGQNDKNGSENCRAARVVTQGQGEQKNLAQFGREQEVVKNLPALQKRQWLILDEFRSCLVSVVEAL